MALIGLPALAIIAVLAHVAASVFVRFGSPDSRQFISRAFWGTVVLQIAYTAGVFTAIAGAI